MTIEKRHLNTILDNGRILDEATSAFLLLFSGREFRSRRCLATSHKGHTRKIASSCRIHILTYSCTLILETYTSLAVNYAFF